MFNIYLVIGGLAILIVAIIKFISLLGVGLDKTLRVSWGWMIAMTVFFSAGYIAYIYLILSKNADIVVSLTAWIFFFGAIYVLLTIITIIHTVKQLKLKDKETIENLQSNNALLSDQSKTLEEEVVKRTQALNDKIKELEEANKLMIGREIKMIELKNENQRLKERIG